VNPGQPKQDESLLLDDLNHKLLTVKVPVNQNNVFCDKNKMAFTFVLLVTEKSAKVELTYISSWYICQSSQLSHF
jgi:hypothetical protein